MKKYELGTTNEVAPDYTGGQFYTVADLIENDDWDTVRELAEMGDLDAETAITENS
jgi:hypothetical protein